jgi:hypothetical protein
VASARLRLRLEEMAAEPVEGNGVRMRVEESETGDADRVSVAFDDPVGTRASRVMIGVLNEDASERLARLEPSIAAEDEGDRAAKAWLGEIELGEDILAAAVYVEDLASGEWIVEALELEGP